MVYSGWEMGARQGRMGGTLVGYESYGPRSNREEVTRMDKYIIERRAREGGVQEIREGLIRYLSVLCILESLYRRLLVTP